MTAAPFADEPPKLGAPVSLITLLPQGGEGRPCPHVRPFEWGRSASLLMGGYSGAGVVANGRTHALFVGGTTHGLPFFQRQTSVTVVLVTHLPRPWENEPRGDLPSSEDDSQKALPTTSGGEAPPP